jgi:hypothetical protein
MMSVALLNRFILKQTGTRSLSMRLENRERMQAAWRNTQHRRLWQSKVRSSLMQRLGRTLMFGDLYSCVGFLQTEQVNDQLGFGGFEPSLCIQREYTNIHSSQGFRLPFWNPARFALCVLPERTQHLRYRLVLHRRDSHSIRGKARRNVCRYEGSGGIPCPESDDGKGGR